MRELGELVGVTVQLCGMSDPFIYIGCVSKFGYKHALSALFNEHQRLSPIVKP